MSSSEPRQTLRTHSIAALLATALLWWLSYAWFGAHLQQLQERLGDLSWRWGAAHEQEHRLVVVDIDEASLQAVGPWPWSRQTMAQLVQKLEQAGAKQQIFDIVMPEAKPGDEALVAALARGPSVLAQVMALEQGGASTTGQLGGALNWSTCPLPFGAATGYLANTPALVQSGAAVGHITPRVGGDGVVRQQPAVICRDDKAYPALGLVAYGQGAGVGSWTLQAGGNWLEPAWKMVPSDMLIPPVPLDERGDLRVSWRLHPDSFISISAADLLSGKAPPDILRHAWVLVGSSAFGLKDSIATPYGGVNAGLLVHAQVISALIDGRTPYTPSGQSALQGLAGALGVLALLALSLSRKRWLPLYGLPLVGLGWAALLWLAHTTLLTQAHLWVGWLGPAWLVLLASVLLAAASHAQSRLERDRLFSHLSSYLPAPVAAALALQSPSGAIKASNTEVSVLFADIRNFSAYLEARPPEEAAAVLHAFFSTATRIVQAHGGVVEAFEGDAVLAVWNAQPSQAHPSGRVVNMAKDHADQALKAAIALHHAMDGVLPDPAPAGLEPLALGIGVETGPAMVGSFGPASRRTHMVLGRTVTIASRLVGMTSELSHPILVGEGLAAQRGTGGLESMGIFMLDGLHMPHHIYAHPLKLSTELPLRLVK